MKYFNATEAAIELGVRKQVITKMINNNQIKTDKKKGSASRIPESEVRRLEKKLKQEQSKNTSQNRKTKHYTATQASEKFKIPRSRIMYLINTGKLYAVKGKAATSPYLIPETEFQKLREIATSGTVGKKEEKVVCTNEKPKEHSNHSQDKYYEDYIEIRKNFITAVRHLAAAQEKMASTLARLVEEI